MILILGKWVALGITTSGSAAKTSVAQGTEIDFKVRSTGTTALCSGTTYLKALARSKLYRRFGGAAAGR